MDISRCEHDTGVSMAAPALMARFHCRCVHSTGSNNPVTQTGLEYQAYDSDNF